MNRTADCSEPPSPGGGPRGGGLDPDGDRQVLKQLVHRLRLKLGDDGQGQSRIETIPAVGYRLNTGPDTTRFSQ